MIDHPKWRHRRGRCSAARYPRRDAQRQGVILIIVLVVLVLLSLSAYTFTALMVAERESSILAGREAQARALADSGVDYVQMYLVQDRATLLGLGGTYDNPASFQGLTVGQDDDAELGGRITIMAPAIQIDGTYAGFRYGLEDESARVNLQVLQLIDEQLAGTGRELLMGLPGMTEEIADAILDWIDADDDPREYGAEIEYYSALNPPYGPKNGPLESIEELLLVRGVTPSLLFGADVNRNGMMDGFELAMATTETADVVDGSMDRGWSAYLTMYSQEVNLTSLGDPKINVNGDDLELLFEEVLAALNDEWATFIVAYRQNGPFQTEDEEDAGGGDDPADADQGAGGQGQGGQAGGGGQAGQEGDNNQEPDDRVPERYSGGELDLTQGSDSTLTQLLDLVGAVVEVTFEGEEEAVLLASPIDEDTAATDLPLIMDTLTTIDAPTIPGRININQAPQAVLYGIPGMTEEIADEILSRRDVTGATEDPNRLYETWLLAEGIVTLDEMRQLSPFICGGGSVFRAQVVGYFPDSGSSARVEVVLDASTPIPTILFWRDISHLGRGYNVATLDGQTTP